MKHQRRSHGSQRQQPCWMPTWTHETQGSVDLDDQCIIIVGGCWSLDGFRYEDDVLVVVSGMQIMANRKRYGDHVWCLFGCQMLREVPQCCQDGMLDPLSSFVELELGHENICWSPGSVGAQREEWLRHGDDAWTKWHKRCQYAACWNWVLASYWRMRVVLKFYVKLLLLSSSCLMWSSTIWRVLTKEFEVWIMACFLAFVLGIIVESRCDAAASRNYWYCVWLAAKEMWKGHVVSWCRGMKPDAKWINCLQQ